MHTIRLREPWTVEFSPSRVIYRRYFNCPTGLGPGHTVRLAIESMVESAAIEFNGNPLSEGHSSWDVTASLQPRNVVEISAAPTTPPESRPFGEVSLLISDF